MTQELYDLLLNEEDDIAIKDGDFVTGASTTAHQRQLILCNKGDFKEEPTRCVGAATYLDDENFDGLVRAITTEFTRDGMDVAAIQLSEGIVRSQAGYQAA